jgi:hypothetical protein
MIDLVHLCTETRTVACKTVSPNCHFVRAVHKTVDTYFPRLGVTTVCRLQGLFTTVLYGTVEEI